MSFQTLKQWMSKALDAKVGIPREAREDIQGLVLKDYHALGHAWFLFLRITEPEGARRWLRTLSVTSVAEASQEWCRNVAFTHDGLARLGLGPDTLETFPLEFREGMAQRGHVLGDTGGSAPEEWEFGGPGEELHILLMLYASTEEKLKALLTEEEGRLGGLVEVFRQRAGRLPAEKEHFGFKDGISQPALRVEGGDCDRPGEEPLHAGEFVLGYRNEYQSLPWSPSIREEAYPKDAALEQLRRHPEAGKRDLGYNGTYLVFRKLEQDVAGFWSFLGQKARDVGSAHCPKREAIRLAAQLMGRWPDGTALTPGNVDRDPLERKAEDALASYRFAEEDSNGRGCPFGSHIRRANPRDALNLNASVDPTGAKKARELSRKIVSRHRLIRRAIPYGPPLVRGEELEGLDVLIRGEEPRADEGQRGLLFLAINANIARQFEFIQQTWLNNEKLEGYYDERDPIASGREAGAPATTHLTLPRTAPYQRLDIHPFVTVKGGAYFFLPSLKALKFLASGLRPS